MTTNGNGDPKEIALRSSEVEGPLKLIMMAMQQLAGQERLQLFDELITEMVATVGKPNEPDARENYAALMAALCHGLISGIRVMSRYLPSSSEGDFKVVRLDIGKKQEGDQE